MSALVRSGPETRPPLDEDLAEPLAGRRLLGERGLELGFADQPAADEQLAEGAPGDSVQLPRLPLSSRPDPELEGYARVRLLAGARSEYPTLST